MPHDTITSDYAQQLTIQAKAHEGKKEYKQALEYQKRLTAINDSLNKKNIEEEMAELATIYQLKEKESEIQQQHEQIQKLSSSVTCWRVHLVWYVRYYGWLGITSAPSGRKTD